MSNRAIAGIVSAASLDIVNAIWQHALPGDLGPGNFSVRLSANGQEPATHFGMYNATVSEADAILWQQLCDGVMPAADWGGDFLPSEQGAIDACAGGNLILDNRAGGGSSIQHWNAVIGGMELARIEPEEI